VSDTQKLRELPAVHEVLEQLAPSLVRFPRALVVSEVRRVIDAARAEILSGNRDVPDIAARVERALAGLERPSLRRVINATGVVLHTNLGRAALGPLSIVAGYSNLEYDVTAGRRGKRDMHTASLLERLVGAPGIAVNNNAAAVFLALHELAAGGEAIVSRGELIEIGGAFRLPEIMSRAGAKLVEVGTTNRTHPRDYENAIGDKTGLVLKVHTSNYRVEGFTAEVGARDLAGLARARNVPLVHDLGSGTLIDLARFGLVHEPTVAEAVADGADLITFSGDKLLGGPQAGFIVGKRALIAAIDRNPMKRALRVDKIRLAAIVATLKLYRDPDRLVERLPTLRFLTRAHAGIEEQARRLAPAVAAAVGATFTVAVCQCQSQIGSGALPLDTIASAGFVIRSLAGGGALDRLAAALRNLERPVIGRIEDGGLILDLRCLTDEVDFLSALSALDRRALV
jgi:L-seryl-tRNA(Ser) seleniumtransferase